MKNNYILISFFLTFLFANISYAQIDCSNNGIDPGLNCATSPIICVGDLDGYCTTNPEQSNAQAPPTFLNACGGGTEHNTQWISFVAGSTNLTLDIRWENCQGGTTGGMSTGIQAEIYTNNSSDCNAPQWEAVPGSCLNQCGAAMGSQVLTMTTLIPGQVYYFIVDGCNGDVCEYTVRILAGSADPPVPDGSQSYISNQVGVMGVDQLCTGCVGEYSVTYIDSMGNIMTEFSPDDVLWTLTPSAAGTFTTPITGKDATTVSVQWNEEGTHQLCIESFIPCGDTFLICQDVVIEDPLDTMYADVLLCPSDLDNPMNGFTYVFPPTGETRLITSSGPQIFTESIGPACCTREVTVNFIVQEDEFEFIDTTICVGDCIFIERLGFDVCPTNNGPINDVIVGAAANGCDINITYQVTIDRITVFLVDVNNETCLGNDGEIVIQVNTGIPPYTFIWSGPTTVPTNVQNPNNLTAGSYSVTVSTANGCEFSIPNIFITQEDGPSGSISQRNDLDCNGDNSGSIFVNASSLNTPINYIWTGPTPVGNTSIGTGLAAGDYQIVISDNVGCTDTLNTTLTEPPALLFDSVNVLSAGCPGDTSGVIELFVLGGQPGYTYTWLPNVSDTSFAFDLPADDYRITITDANGCQIDTMLTVLEPMPLSFGIVTSNLTCRDTCNGSISLTPAGGTAPYTFQWSDGMTGNPRTGLCAGDYIFTIVDSRGCELIDSTTLTQPQALSLVVESTTNVACNGDSTGAIDISVTGGTGAYTYLWSYGAAPTQDLANIPAGTYSITVTDGNGCTIIEPAIVITERPALGLVLTPTNISCFGGNDGQIIATASGGSGSYNYIWNPAQGNVATAGGLTAGTYMITVQDAATPSCFITDMVTLTQPDSISISGTAVPAVCGVANGSIDLTVSGGTVAADYTYAWDPAAPPVQDPTGLTPNIYTVTVTDDNMCTKTFSISVITPDGLTVEVGPNTSDVVCFGETNGVIDINITGGTPFPAPADPYTIVWDEPSLNGMTDSVGVAAGVYLVTVTDADDCEVTATVTIDEPPLLDVAGVAAQATCGQPNGSIDLMISGGTPFAAAPAYSTVWSDPALNGQIDPVNLLAGMYSVTVTDANGCVDTLDIEVPTPDTLILSFTQVDILCNGDSTGSIDVTVTGGTAPFDYNWNGTAFDGMQDLSGVPAGGYTLIVTDDNGCTDTIMPVLLEPQALSLSAVQGNVSCNGGDDGSISLSIAGGVMPYTYDWSDDRWDGNSIADTLPAGSISVIVTDDNGCTISSSFTITEPTALSLSSAVTAATCGEANGEIEILPAGGTIGAGSDYGYAWSGPSPAAGNNPTGLLPGVYTLSLTDDNDCLLIDSFDVTTPNALAASSTKVDVLCNSDSTGAISVTITGGNSSVPYQLDWNQDQYDGMQNLTGLPAGFYSLTVTDGDGCEVFVDRTILEPQALAMSTTFMNVDCNGADNGSIDVQVTGGVEPYAYTWTGGVSVDSFATGLSPNTYTITVTDANGCTATTDRQITQPTALSATDVHTDISCNGGSDGTIALTISGGTPLAGGIYNYLWADDPTINAANRTGLAVGTYNVLVTDANDCQLPYAVTLTEPDTLSLTVNSTTNIDCNANATGAIDISVAGGTGNYSYVWSRGDVTEDLSAARADCYVVTITDDNGCVFVSDSICLTEPQELTLSATSVNATCGEANGSIDLTVMGGTAPFTYAWTSGLPAVEDPDMVFAGTYTVTVTDANNCTAQLTESVVTPNGLEITNIVTDSVSCFGGSDGTITLDVMGGRAPFQIAWSGGTQSPTDSSTVTDLAIGMYTVTVTDADTCSVTAMINIMQPEELITAFNQSQATCGLANGAIDLIVTGGVQPYSFNWDQGLPPVEDPQNVFAGTYNVIVTDANNCTATQQVEVLTPPTLGVTAQATQQVSCFGEAQGQAQASTTGGTAPFTYAWSAGTFDPNSPQVTQLPRGTHTVTVTDVNDCTAEANVTITEPDELISSAAVAANVNCFEGSDGAINTTVTGGTTPYSYAWTGSATGPNPTGLPAGIYTVTITDANDCSSTAQATITQPGELTLSAAATTVSCFGLDDGTLAASAAGGTTPYTYAWSAGLDPVSSPQNPIVAGTYTVTVTDANGCTATAQATVRQPEAILLDVRADMFGEFNVSCAGLSDGRAEVTITGGVTPYNIVWSNGQTGAEATNLTAPQSLDVSVTDANGCESVGKVSLTAPELISASVSTRQPRCFGDRNGQIVIDSVSGGLGSYTFSYDGGPFTSNTTQNNVPVGTYDVIIQDLEGCELLLQATVTEPLEISVDLGEDEFIQLGESTQIIPLSTLNAGVPIDTFFWDLPVGYDCDATDPFSLCIDTPSQTTKYVLRIIDENGCRAQDEKTVFVEKLREVWFPNVFSPNEDGVNEIFGLTAGPEVRHIKKFYIYNRWGERMFLAEEFTPQQAPDPINGWDGTFKNEMMDPGVYVYFAEVEFIDGEVLIFKGDITLVR